MPSGDPQRTWFPEMIARLRKDWHTEMSMPMLIDMRDRLDEMHHRTRAGRNIQTPIMTCRKCGRTGHAAEPRVSVRAMILALARFGIAPKDKAKANTASNSSWISMGRRRATASTDTFETRAKSSNSFWADLTGFWVLSG